MFGFFEGNKESEPTPDNVVEGNFGSNVEGTDIEMKKQMFKSSLPENLNAAEEELVRTVVYEEKGEEKEYTDVVRDYEGEFILMRDVTDQYGMVKAIPWEQVKTVIDPATVEIPGEEPAEDAPEAPEEDEGLPMAA